MMKTNKVTLFLISILLLLLRCQEQRNNSILFGNWYFKTNNDYIEVFIDKNTFTYHFLSVKWRKYNYCLNNDTIVLFEGPDSLYANYKILNNNKILLKINSRLDTLFRIDKNEYTIENFLQEENYQKFTEAFYRRMKKAGVSFWYKK